MFRLSWDRGVAGQWTVFMSAVPAHHVQFNHSFYSCFPDVDVCNAVTQIQEGDCSFKSDSGSVHRSILCKPVNQHCSVCLSPV